MDSLEAEEKRIRRSLRNEGRTPQGVVGGSSKAGAEAEAEAAVEMNIEQEVGAEPGR